MFVSANSFARKTIIRNFEDEQIKKKKKEKEERRKERKKEMDIFRCIYVCLFSKKLYGYYYIHVYIYIHTHTNEKITLRTRYK